MIRQRIVILCILLLTTCFLSAQAPEVTHIYPFAGINTQSMTAHVYGDSFAGDTVSSVKLIRSGYPDINGTSLNVLSQNYFTCSFDLGGASIGLYDVVVANSATADTLPYYFTVYSPSPSPYLWEVTTIGSGSNVMWGICVGDANDDSELEVYSSNGDYNVYQFKWTGMSWTQSSVGSNIWWAQSIVVGDGNNDKGKEVYAAWADNHMYQYKWNGSSWTETSMGIGGSRFTGVDVGDADYDGENEVYGSNFDNNVHQFKWDGAVWSMTVIGSGTADMGDVAVGDGNNDGEIEVYGACDDNSLYQFKWDGVSWTQTTLGTGSSVMTGVAVGDGNNDGEMEVYGSNWDAKIYQYKWNGANWIQTTVASCGNGVYSVAVGDGDGDGEREVYGAIGNAAIYQFKWNGASWVQTTVATNVVYRRIAVGDGNYDGKMEVYGARGNGPAFQCKPVAYADIALSDTMYDFGGVPVGDSLDWQYLVIKNVGNDTLYVDSLISDTVDYTVVNPTFPNSIIPNDSTLVTVRFKPSLDDTINGELTLYCNDPYEPVVNVSLTGVGIDATPPIPFNLIAPPDSVVLAVVRPDFIWESSFDSISGMRYYEVYIDDTARTICVDTAWTVDYDLDEGFHDWYIIAYDSADNIQQSNEIWTVLVDTTQPSMVNLIFPVHQSYLNNSSVNFLWHEAGDNFGVSHYIVQYALDSLFSLSLVESITVDTSFTEVLYDTVYYWRVMAVDHADNSGPWSNVWQFTVDTQTPGTPVLVTPIGGGYFADTLVSFEWTQVAFTLDYFRQGRMEGNGESGFRASPVRYILEIDSLDNFAAPVVVDTFDTTNAILNISEGYYYWRVKAYDLSGNQGSYSNPDSFGSDISAPIIDSTTVWPDTSYAGPFEVFTKVSDNLCGVDSVFLHYKLSYYPTWIVRSMHYTGSPGWYLDSIPIIANPNDTILYYIRATDMVQNESTDPPGAPSNHYLFVANMMGVGESYDIPDRFTFTVNGFAKKNVTFSFALPQKSSVSVKVYDALGRLIATPISGKLHSGIYKISFVPKRTGIYFYHLKSEYLNKKGKLIVF